MLIFAVHINDLSVSKFMVSISNSSGVVFFCCFLFTTFCYQALLLIIFLQINLLIIEGDLVSNKGNSPSKMQLFKFYPWIAISQSLENSQIQCHIGESVETHYLIRVVNFAFVKMKCDCSQIICMC